MSTLCRVIRFETIMTYYLKQKSIQYREEYTEIGKINVLIKFSHLFRDFFQDSVANTTELNQGNIPALVHFFSFIYSSLHCVDQIQLRSGGDSVTTYFDNNRFSFINSLDSGKVLFKTY